jgi:hypothetical protein
MIERHQRNASRTDPYARHRLALRPLLHPSDPAVEQAIAALVQRSGVAEFLAFLQANGLTQLWLNRLQEQPNVPAPPGVLEAMRDHARLTAAHQLRQGLELRGAAHILEAQSIPWFVFKGVQLRHSLYADPILRPVSDIDLCVPPAAAATAIDCFLATGFEAATDPATISHEITLRRQGVAIDLHWHILRPGRYRPGLTRWLFQHRQRFDGLWGLDATAGLLVMLVHPAIAKYLASPTSMLIHLVDQARLIQSDAVDWLELEAALRCFGTQSSAWASLYLLRELGRIEAPGEFATRIRPGRMHAWYLRQWIDRAWITRWFGRRWLVAGGFSLALHDSVTDVARALLQRSRALRGAAPTSA